MRRKSQKKSSEIVDYFELQSTWKELRKARQLTEVGKAKRDHEKAPFQVKKEGLLYDLKQVQADKVEAERRLMTSK